MLPRLGGLNVKRMLMLAILLVLGSGSGLLAAQDDIAGRLLGRVKVLTSPALAGRGAGSREGHAAGDTVAAWFAAQGLQPAFAGAWFQEFPLHGEGWSGQALEGLTGRNVAGTLPGKGNLAGRYVLVSAHYDHLGRSDGDTLGQPPAADSYYPGANDNASGVTVLVETAARCRRRVPDSRDLRSVLFVSFDGEETGLLGSRFLVDHMPVPLDSLDAMINLDTVGQMGQGKLYVSGVGTTPAFPRLAADADFPGLELSLAAGGWSGSDHLTFNARKIPALFIFGGPYPQYNRPADRWDTLDPEALGQVADYVDRLLSLVRSITGPLPWIKIGESEAGNETTGEGNHNTWLGTMPDFTAGIVGYKIGGVFDASPAAAAGLAKGDVLVRFGGREVRDLATFTTALRAFNPGEPVEITLLRGGRSLNFTVVLGDRAQRR